MKKFLISLFILALSSPSLAAELKPEQYEMIEKAFKGVDINGDGKYGLDEWKKYYDANIRPAILKQFSENFVQNDKNGDQFISRDEFVGSEDDLAEIKQFESWDTDRDNKANIDDIMRENDNKNFANFLKILPRIDTNNDGAIDWEEYKSYHEKLFSPKEVELKF